jgi:hypothetical protein
MAYEPQNASLPRQVPSFAAGDYLTVPQASQHSMKFGMPAVPIGTLNKLRVVGGGPPFHRFGRRIVYPRLPYEDWLLKRLTKQVNSTSEFARNVAW